MIRIFYEGGPYDGQSEDVLVAPSEIRMVTKLRVDAMSGDGRMSGAVRESVLYVAVDLMSDPVLYRAVEEVRR